MGGCGTFHYYTVALINWRKAIGSAADEKSSQHYFHYIKIYF